MKTHLLTAPRLRRRTRTAITVTAVLVAGAATGVRGQSVLSTGITGRVSGTGLADPQYVLSFPEIQALVLDAVDAPLDEDRIRTALDDTPVRLQHLLDHGLLASTEDGRYRLSYLLLTVEDLERIHEVARPMGADLARAIGERTEAFDELLAGYRSPELRDDLLFGLVAGLLLNWEGLRLTTELGYRAETPARPNGDRYLVHSSERGADIETKGLYWGSHSYPGPRTFLSTFGDGPSQPRLYGLPDSYTEPIEAGLATLQDEPELAGPLQAHLISILTGGLDDLGDLMLAAAADAAPSEAGEPEQPGEGDALGRLADRAGLERSVAGPAVAVLEATGYLVESDGRYRPGVPVLTEEDRTMVEGVRELGRGILTEWLEANHPVMRRELSDLSPMRNGVPFELAFSEVWHKVFGFTTLSLAETGFYADPYAPGRTHVGFVPLVWASSLRIGPP